MSGRVREWAIKPITHRQEIKREVLAKMDKEKPEYLWLYDNKTVWLSLLCVLLQPDQIKFHRVLKERDTLEKNSSKS